MEAMIKKTITHHLEEKYKYLIPSLNEDEFSNLETSCLNNGIQDSIKVWNGVIIDGHNRYKIANEHNLVFSVLEMEFKSEAEAKKFMIVNQLGRRNLSAYQRSVLVLDFKEIVSKEAEERKRVKQFKKSAKTDDFAVTQNSAEGKSEPTETRDILAEKAGVSHDTLRKVEIIQEKATPEIKEQLEKEDITIHRAFNEVRKIEIKKLREHMPKPVLPNGKYEVIYADPPWKYNDKQDTSKLGGAEKHYPTMDIEELCKLNVSKISADNSVLFIWVTSPLLEDSFKIINSWGFKYKSSFVWDKISHNMGHYNSVRHEFLLIATKGSYTPEKKKLFDSVQSIQREKHSKKPEVFRKIIETIYPSSKKIELFARKKTNKWDTFGNEL